MFFDGSEPCVALYSSLILHFRPFRKKSKIRWKTDVKIEAFWWLRTTFGVILFAYFTLSAFSKKVEKSMPKWRPKVADFDPKCDLGRPMVDWFYHFRRFLKIRKIVDFSTSLLGDEKSIKIDPWALRGCHRVSEYRAMVPDFGVSAPRAGPARVLSVDKNRYLKYRYIKTGIYNISNIKYRYIIHVSGSNTPMGRWPGEFRSRSEW